MNKMKRGCSVQVTGIPFVVVFKGKKQDGSEEK